MGKAWNYYVAYSSHFTEIQSLYWGTWWIKSVFKKAYKDQFYWTACSVIGSYARVGSVCFNRLVQLLLLIDEHQGK